MTPIDADAYVGLPDLFTPQYDEVHISVTFTWDLKKVKELEYAWSKYGCVVVGGVALDDCGGIFCPGKYVKHGVTITSRGCPNKCGFCFVPKREGRLRILPIVEGNIIQDNNLTACPRNHIDNVFDMLAKQSRIVFQGGVESARVDDYFVGKLRSIRLKEVWMAYDHDNADKPLERAVGKLSKYFKRDKLRCYVLIGYKDDTIEKADVRLRKAWEIGVLPFAMLYRDEQNTPHSKEWRKFQREWARPAIMRSKMKGDKI